MSNERDNFYNAAKWGIWTWIAVTLLPLLIVVLCCVGCLFTGIIGSMNQGSV